MVPMTLDDYDALVIGAGHNGMVTAAYLAKAGFRTGLFDARVRLGGVAGSDPLGGGMVNNCNCDHLTFRTTPVMDELDLGATGLEYVDLSPGQLSMAWNTRTPWASHLDVEQTLDSLASAFPGEIEGYRNYVAAAVPAAQAVLDAANQPPSASALTRLAVRRRLAGIPTLLRWGRRSAGDVISSYFSSDALRAPAMAAGPMVWGVSPLAPGTGLGALTYAMRHVAKVGRPVGGSGALPAALATRFESDGGRVHLSSRVVGIVCDGDAVRGIELLDGTSITAPVVVSACDPESTFVRWLKNPPAAASAMIARWRDTPHDDGYESKIDAILTEAPRVKGLDHPLSTTLTVAPSIDEMHRGAGMIGGGRVLDHPGFLINVPSLADPTVAPAGRHVFSLEVLYTPYALRGGWPGSGEPERWLDLVAELCEPGFKESIVDYRAMTPDVYEREFFMPRGRAANFSGGALAALRNRQPELTRYHTPVRGLYLTGAATFPGAGVWGASGRNCATVILAES